MRWKTPTSSPSMLGRIYGMVVSLLLTSLFCILLFSFHNEQLARIGGQERINDWLQGVAGQAYVDELSIERLAASFAPDELKLAVYRPLAKGRFLPLSLGQQSGLYLQPGDEILVFLDRTLPSLFERLGGLGRWPLGAQTAGGSPEEQGPEDQGSGWVLVGRARVYGCPGYGISGF